jgi:tetratricopeptide (TPR) repeat protein
MPEIDVKTFRLIIKAGIPLQVLAFLGATWLWNRFRARLNPREAAGEANARGQQLMQRGDLDAAEREYTNAIRLCPTEPNCHYNRAVLRIKQRRLDEAIDDLQQATELAPQDAQLHNKLGVTLRLAQRYTESMASCDESIRLQPENATFYLARGATLEELASEEAALRNYSRAAELDPDLLMARQQRARLYRQRRQFPEALEDLNYILGREPRSEEVWNLRAIVKSEFGDHSGAIDDSSRAVEPRPCVSRSWPDPGCAHWLLGSSAN